VGKDSSQLETRLDRAALPPPDTFLCENKLGLVRYDAMCSAIAECHRVDEVKDIRNKARALEVYAALAKDTEAEYKVCRIRIRAERRAGELLKETQKNGQRHGRGQKSKVGRPDFTPTRLSDIGISKDQSSQWQKLAGIHESVLEAYFAQPGKPSTEGTFAYASGQVAQVILSSDCNEWYTLPEHIEAARQVLGEIDLDPASHLAANDVVKAKKFFTMADDGLQQEWKGRIWLNPPWGQAGPDFVGKLVESYKAGTVTAAVLLVNSHATDTKWFQPLWDFTLCFTCPRIKYWQPNGGGNSPTNGSTFVYFGSDKEKFVEVFSKYGVVVERFRARQKLRAGDSS